MQEKTHCIKRLTATDIKNKLSTDVGWREYCSIVLPYSIKYKYDLIKINKDEYSHLPLIHYNRWTTLNKHRIYFAYVVCKSIFHFLHAVYCKNITSVVSIGFVLRKGKLNIWKHGYHHNFLPLHPIKQNAADSVINRYYFHHAISVR